MSDTDRKTVTIYYKSGHKITIDVQDMEVVTERGVISSVKITDTKPYPLHIGVGEIESIWEHC